MQYTDVEGVVTLRSDETRVTVYAPEMRLGSAVVGGKELLTGGGVQLVSRSVMSAWSHWGYRRHSRQAEPPGVSAWHEIPVPDASSGSVLGSVTVTVSISVEGPAVRVKRTVRLPEGVSIDPGELPSTSECQIPLRGPDADATGWWLDLPPCKMVRFPASPRRVSVRKGTRLELPRPDGARLEGLGDGAELGINGPEHEVTIRLEQGYSRASLLCWPRGGSVSVTPLGDRLWTGSGSAALAATEVWVLTGRIR